jgi:hypothetical protein
MRTCGMRSRQLLSGLGAATGVDGICGPMIRRLLCIARAFLSTILQAVVRGGTSGGGGGGMRSKRVCSHAMVTLVLKQIVGMRQTCELIS